MAHPAEVGLARRRRGQLRYFVASTDFVSDQVNLVDRSQQGPTNAADLAVRHVRKIAVERDTQTKRHLEVGTSCFERSTDRPVRAQIE